MTLEVFRLARELRLSMSHIWCLAEIRTQGPMNKTRLAASIGVTTGAMTGIADVLKGEGLLEEFPVIGNRREHEVRLSLEAVAYFEELEGVPA